MDELFGNYKKKYLTVDEVKSFVKELETSSEIYKNILSPEEDVFKR